MRSGYEDWDFSLRLARAGYRGLRVAKPLYVYHIADDAAPSRSTEIDTKRLYGGLWRHIRERHAESYTMAAMMRLWKASRDGSGRVPLWKGVAACALARPPRRRNFPCPAQGAPNENSGSPPHQSAVARAA